MSTPIETNTEELQEILQTVYNLPMAGGGSAEPDLVIGLDTSDLEAISDSPEKLTFESADVINAYNKLLSGETVNCVLNAKYRVDSGPAINASSPQIALMARSEGNNSARVGFMLADFNLRHINNVFNGTVLVEIEFSIHGNNTASVVNITASKYVAYSSASL